MDIGALSDEDVGLGIGPEDGFDWAELEGLMGRKGLLRAGQHPVATAAAPPSVPAKRKGPATTTTTTTVPSGGGAAKGSPRRRPSVDMAANAEEPASSQAAPASQSSLPKPKRVIKTAEASAAVPRRVHSVPMDEAGKAVLPVTCGIVTVHDLGRIVYDRATFHNKRYIWPVGFKSSRQYQSAARPDDLVTYYSEIKDGGAGPSFEVWAEDAPEARFQSNTSTGAWTAVFKAAAALRGKDSSNSASGPDFYGFSNNTIAMLIETLPGVENCLNYQRKNFEVLPPPIGGRRLSVSKADLDVDVEGEEGIEEEEEGAEEGEGEDPVTMSPEQPISQLNNNNTQSQPGSLFDLASQVLERMDETQS